GIGHPFRGDDAVGPAVAEAVAALSLPNVTTLAHHGEGTDLMERWQSYDYVVVVDATASGAEPGTTRRWDAAQALPAALFPKGSHVFGLAEAVEMARLLGRLPPKLTVIGIEGADFTVGAAMTAAVVGAVETLPAAIAALIELNMTHAATSSR
ncbi:MAG: hydrogenase maturation protease, partial [Magnetospirillum sp.]|nr:hydrogenase maturation protease [Magnetospirillum sp.]